MDDTMGDAEQDEYDEELPPPRERLLTSEALAVTSLATAIGSFFVTSLSQYLVFLFASALGFDSGNNQQRQVALLMAPTTILSFAAVAAGLPVLKRRPADRWVGALAVAGVTLGGAIFLLATGAMLVAWIHDPVFRPTE